MEKTKVKTKSKVTKILMWSSIGVLIFCVALRLMIIGEFERPINLKDYKEETAEVIDKQLIEDSTTKTKYTIGIKTSSTSKILELGKPDYNNLTIGDAIYILVSEDEMQLGTKEQPYTVIKVQE